MIAFIKGIIEQVEEDNVVIDVGGVGYNVKISAGTANMLPGNGQLVKIYTYTCVREDAFQLYGFLSKDDLAVFKKLITVSGIGPKGGLAILSVMDADNLRFAILSGDAKAIAKAPGIGAKTAERVILELRDKISIEDTFVTRESKAYSDKETSENENVRNDVIEALTALGYSPSDSLKAIKQVEYTKDMDSEQLLKEVLKKMF